VRAVVVQDDRSLAEVDVEEPQPGEGQVRVRVAACGICGSDIHMRPSAALEAGSIMGHEFTGVVDLLEPGVEGLSEGDRVVVFPFKPLDHHDIEVAMSTGLGLGVNPGAYAEAVVVSADMVWRLPESVDLEHGTLVEPLAVALHGLNVGEVTPGDRCAVIGAGPIGVMVAHALRARGVERTVVVEKNARRLGRIRSLGFEAVGLDSVHADVMEQLGGAPDVVLECAGNPAAPDLAIELVAQSGRIVLLGVLEEPVQVSQLNLILKEAQLRASFAYRPADFDESISLIAAGRIPCEDLITAREPLARADELFAALENPGTDEIKVVLRP
jgi:(R,R)-butanediol dehydrogenase/meso-butanediol dehydrogenase/diacetyl reductase